MHDIICIPMVFKIKNHRTGSVESSVVLTSKIGYFLVGLEVIVNFSKKNNNDLIIIGTHSRTGVDKFLLGSVTEKVIRSAQCSVLTLKMEEKEFII